MPVARFEGLVQSFTDRGDTDVMHDKVCLVCLVCLVCFVFVNANLVGCKAANLVGCKAANLVGCNVTFVVMQQLRHIYPEKEVASNKK